jgi:hypothetical protein
MRVLGFLIFLLPHLALKSLLPMGEAFAAAGAGHHQMHSLLVGEGCFLGELMCSGGAQVVTILLFPSKSVG